MTDNRTTELLCKLLDEHGIAWKKRRGYIRWSKQTKYGVTHYQAWPCFDGTVTITVRDEYGLTPEQAIAATLGRPTCEYVIEDNMNESEGMGDVWFRCTNCDTCYDYYADDWLLKMPHCPKCGATVKGVR